MFGLISLGLLLLGFSARVRFGRSQDVTKLAMELPLHEDL